MPAKKDKTQESVRYKSGVAHSGEIKGQPYKEYTYDDVLAPKEYHKRYNNVICKLFGIEGCERNLIDWIAENMSDEGYINNNATTRIKFIKFHEEHKPDKNKPYRDTTVNAAFNNLEKAELLIRREKGLYQVNPIYFSKKTNKDRLQSIKLVMEFQSGKKTKIRIEE